MCNTCPEVFASRSAKENHVSTVHQKYAELKCSDGTKLRVERDMDGMFQCPAEECVKTFLDARLIRLHYKRSHVDNDELSAHAPTPPQQLLAPPSPPQLPLPPLSPVLAPMDLDLDPHSLHIPEDLAPFGLGLNPTHLILICTSCHTGLRRAHLLSHFKSFHKTIKLPGLDVLGPILDAHHIKADKDIVQPTGLIAPIQGIAQHRGHRCKVVDCGYVTVSAASIKKHVSLVHPGIGVQKDWMEECLVQSFFQVHPHYFQVLGDLG